MVSPTPIRRLAALMFTDIVGYSAMAYSNEQLAMELVKEHRDIIRKLLPEFGGVERQTAGDGFFLEFGSCVEAVRCATAVQTMLYERHRHIPADRQLKIRIGIHLGDIVSSEQDLFGNGVNVAARIEPFAPPGGIAISRQVFDQVDGKIPHTAFRKLGARDLKNIKSGAEIFRVVLPWEYRPETERGFSLRPWLRKIARQRTGNGLALTMTTAILTSVLAIALWNGWAKSAQEMGAAELHEKFVIGHDWEYLLPDKEPDLWQPFNPRQTWKTADQIVGSYWLRHRFSLSPDKFKEPAMVLGLVSDAHRVYVNGHFVGGSNIRADLALYPIDPGLLREGAPNEILIKAETRPHLNPGLEILSGIGAYISEFPVARGDVLWNQIYFHVGRSLFFVLASILFVACLAYTVFSRGKKHFIYSTLFLLLACLNFSYYVAWIDAAFTYPFLRYLKAVSLGLVPFVMAAGFFHSIGKKRWEYLNNLLTLGYLVGLAFAMARPGHTADSFIDTYNLSLAVAGLYGVAWLTWAFVDGARHLLAHGWHTDGWFRYNRVFLWIAFVSIGPIVGGFKGSIVSEVVSPSLRRLMTDVSFLSPFVFSMLVVGVMVGDAIQKTKVMKRKQECDDLKLRMVHMMHTVSNVKILVEQIQKEICQAVGANRSTLYVFDHKEQQKLLRADYIFGQVAGNFQVTSQLDPTSGVVGYVLENRTPLLLEDIRKDPRFSGPGAKYPVALNASYRTGSCMIFPLISSGETVGVLTIADKGESSFSEEDFTLTLELASMLGLLIENSRIRSVAHLSVVATA